MYICLMEFIIVLFLVIVGGFWLLAKGLGEVLFQSKKQPTFIDKSIHYHTIINKHEHRSISIIDDVTKKKIFELKDENKI